MTTTHTPSTQSGTDRARVIGLDVARGLAIIGMMAAHVVGTINDDGSASLTGQLAAGRSATGFAMIAGISLAFISGRRRPPTGRPRLAAAAAIAARGVLIGVIGLMLAYLGAALVILSSYGLMFLLVIPLLWLRPRAVAAIAGAIGVLGPALLILLADNGLAFPESPLDPTLTSVVSAPGEVLTLLLFTGSYPAAVYLSYMAAGVAIGRLDLTAPRVMWTLFGGGALLAASARVISWLTLSRLGGFDQLVAHTRAVDVADGEDPASRAEIVQELTTDSAAPLTGSWWYLGVPAPHSHSIADVGYTLGTAMAVLGLCLLLTRVTVVAKALTPIADVGAMPLTLYSAHLVLIATGILGDWPTLLFIVMVFSAVVFATLWRRQQGQGPLEHVVGDVSGWVKRGVLAGRSA